MPSVWSSYYTLVAWKKKKKSTRSHLERAHGLSTRCHLVTPWPFGLFSKVLKTWGGGRKRFDGNKGVCPLVERVTVVPLREGVLGARRCALCRTADGVCTGTEPPRSRARHVPDTNRPITAPSRDDIIPTDRLDQTKLVSMSHGSKT